MMVSLGSDNPTIFKRREKNNMQPDSHSVDYATITERQQATWATGDFHEIARQTKSASEALCEAVDPRPGQRVLDVACGSGNAALVAARRYCEVTGIDYVPALIERAEARARAEGFDVDFHVGDAQALPFREASFDVVVSVFGVMFAPDQEKAASEMLRVCRPGGRIGLASWMPEDFGGDFFAAHARHAPPPANLAPPVRWGTDAGLVKLLGAACSSIESERRSITAYYRSIDHAMEVFRIYFGPTNRAFQTVDADVRESLRKDIETIFRRYNIAADGTAVLKQQYLRTIATRA